MHRCLIQRWRASHQFGRRWQPLGREQLARIDEGRRDALFDARSQSEFGFWDGLRKVQRWRLALLKKPSLIQAVRPDYPELLLRFLSHAAVHCPGIPQNSRAGRGTNDLA